MNNGRTTVFCPISGCSPEVPCQLQLFWGYEKIRPFLGPLVVQAFSELATEEEERVNDVTVIGDFEAHKDQDPAYGIPKEDALRIPDSRIAVLRHCRRTSHFYWYFGYVNKPTRIEGEEHEGVPYLVWHGVLTMVQTFALHILHLATHGKVTPARLWRLAMHQGNSDMRTPGGSDYGLVGIYYGEIHPYRDRHPTPIPYMSSDAVISLEELGNVEAIKDAIVHRGGFWMWMSPDRFPTEIASDYDASSFIFLEPPVACPVSSVIEKLPFELLCTITHQLPMSALLSLASTSRAMRTRLLAFEADRNAIARGWILQNAPWYIPVNTASDEPRFEMSQVHDPWAYLRRCLASASMRNRERIWKVAERIGVRAEQLDM